MGGRVPRRPPYNLSTGARKSKLLEFQRLNYSTPKHVSRIWWITFLQSGGPVLNCLHFTTPGGKVLKTVIKQNVIRCEFLGFLLEFRFHLDYVGT